MNAGIYLFCLAPASSFLDITGTGIDGEHALFVETIGNVAAVLAEVDIDDFSGPEAKEKMEDLTWVAPRALRHEEVILSAMKHCPVLPVRFGTVFSSLAAAAEPLRQRQDIFEKFFLDTADKQEWTLKGYVNRAEARSEMTAARLAEDKEMLEVLTPGRRYFLVQKIKGIVDKDMSVWLKELCNDIFLATREASVGFSECRLQSREVTGRDDDMFFNGALLVPNESTTVLKCIADQWNMRHAAQGLQIELSGPWAPYHFAPVL